MYMDSLINKQKKINESLKRYGVKFGIYKNNTFHEQLFHFDCIPRIITKEEFDDLRSQIATSNGKGGRRYRPYMFTE